MLGRSYSLYLVVALFVAPFAGCKKSRSDQQSGNQSPQPQTAASTNSVASEFITRIHWLGIKRIAADNNAATFMGIWNLPETQKLEVQTLDKLALALWDLPRSGTNLAATIATNPAAALLRPLLDDLLQEECYFEIHQLPNQPVQAVLALHLDELRATLWKSNFAAALQSPSTNHPSIITNYSLSHAGQWTLLSQNLSDPLLRDLTARIESTGTPSPDDRTNAWVDAEIDLQFLATCFGQANNIGFQLPKMSLTAVGLPQGVRISGDLTLREPFLSQLEPWNIPTNFLHDPVDSFTAIRGTRETLKSLKLWQNLHLESAPDQVYFWALQGMPFLSYGAAPMTNATNIVQELTERLIQANSWMATNAMGKFEQPTNFHGVVWGGFPFLTPYLAVATLNQTEYIAGGLFPNPPVKSPPPPELFQEFSVRTNLVYYDWELTGHRIEGWIYIAQVMRLLFHKAQIPPEAVSLAWLEVLKSHLANSITVCTRTSPTQFSYIRNSTAGLTGIELQFLADWLESPEFPCGLQTLLGKTSIRHYVRTNALTNATSLIQKPSSPPSRVNPATNLPPPPKP